MNNPVLSNDVDCTPRHISDTLYEPQSRKTTWRVAMYGNRHITLWFALILWLASNNALAEIAESYKCKLNPGITRDELLQVGEDYLAIQNDAQYHDFQLTILFPKYGADTSSGTFYWNGVSPNIERLEAAVAIWESAENKAVLERWVKVVQDCESATLFESITIAQKVK